MTLYGLRSAAAVLVVRSTKEDFWGQGNGEVSVCESVGDMKH